VKEAFVRIITCVAFLLFSIIGMAGGYETGNALCGEAPTQETARGLQRILERGLVSTRVPGIVIEVDTPRWAWRSAAGKSSIKPPVAADPSMKFRIASASKTFMAAAILRLAGEGRLSLSDPIDRWLPEKVAAMVPRHSRVTVRMLLDHRSGIVDRDLAVVMAAQHNRPDRPLVLEEAIRLCIDSKASFSPDTRWAYSNAAYMLLTLIVDRAAGVSYEEYVRSRIIEKLALGGTIMPTSPAIKGIPGPHMCCLYPNKGAAFWIDGTDMYMTWSRGAGDIISSTADLTTFHKALREGRLFNNSATLVKMRTFRDIPSLSINGMRCSGGLGYMQMRSDILNTTLEGHVGGYSGAVTAMLYWVEGDTFITFNTNGSYSPGYEAAFIFPIIEHLGRQGR
jgi:D-alanyl-D-alanine carboxypeptidase